MLKITKLTDEKTVMAEDLRKGMKIEYANKILEVVSVLSRSSGPIITTIDNNGNYMKLYPTNNMSMKVVDSVKDSINTEVEADKIVEKVYQQTGIRLIKNYPTSITKNQYFDSVKDGKYVSELKPGDVITKKDGSKWNVVLVRHTHFGIQVRMNSKASPVKTEEITYRPTDMLAYDSCKDAEHEADVDLDFLIKDEIEAIDGYRKMIAKTSNPQLLSVLSHILDEETEHIEELRAAQVGVYEVNE